MRRKLINFLLLSILVTGCASTSQKSQDIPSASAQKPEEQGTQSTGRIVEILKSVDDAISPDFAPLTFGEFLILPFLPFVLFTGDFINLFAPSNEDPDPFGNTLEAMKREALEGDADAQLNLYYKSPVAANLVWLCRAADQGKLKARNELAKLYCYGSEKYPKFESINIAPDLPKSCMWSHLAGLTQITNQPKTIDAQLFSKPYESPEVERTVKVMTAHELEEAEKLLQAWEPGRCVRDFSVHLGADYVNSSDLSWLCMAADQGHFPSRDVLGQTYFLGLNGVDVDLPRAYMWYQLAARVYVPSSIGMRGDITQFMCDSMTTEQRANTLQLLEVWMPGQCELDLLQK